MNKINAHPTNSQEQDDDSQLLTKELHQNGITVVPDVPRTFVNDDISIEKHAIDEVDASDFNLPIESLPKIVKREVTIRPKRALIFRQATIFNN